MANLLQHAGWLLLAPEPTEEQRRQDLPLLFVFLGGFALLGGVYDYLVDGLVSNGFSLPIMGFFCLLNALLYALPTHRRWATLGVRAALTLTFLALAASLFPRFGGSLGRTWLGLMCVLAFVVAMFCTNYFLNRRRARRSRPTAQNVPWSGTMPP